MIDIQNIAYTPSIEEIGEYIRNPLFGDFWAHMEKEYKANCKAEYSKCSWEPGWNIKFKKSGKSLCTVYPRESYFTVLVVVGKKEKEKVEGILPELPEVIREIYHRTEEGNGQRWLMIDVEDEGEVYDGVLQLIDIRKNSR